MPRIRPIVEVEREQIGRAMRAYSGDKRAAAQSLGISLNTLYNRLNEYGDNFNWASGAYQGEGEISGRPSDRALMFWDVALPRMVRPPEEVVAQSIELHVGKFCVYQHIRDGEVVYVGMGQWNRPFADSRNDAWNEEIEKGGPIQIRVLAWFDTERDARAYEAEAIRYLRPRLNVVLNSPLGAFDFASLSEPESQHAANSRTFF